jgi:N-acyl-D-amino-acid deacylase
MDMDILLANGLMIDGIGSAGRQVDIGISGEKIAAVGNLTGVKANRMIDAAGMVICPGLIDIHAHGEEQLLATPGAEAKIMQGITTMVGGNCGISAAPISGPLAGFAGDVFNGVEITWSDYEQFFDRLEAEGTAINLACLVGNATIRACVLGMSARRPNPTEVNQMKQLVNEAMQQGAFGLSSGLVYAPGCYSDTNEVADLAREAARYGGFYATHIRGMARPIYEAIEEAISIGRIASLPVQVSHLNPGYPSWENVQELIEIIETARRKGLDITADTLVYNQSVFSGGSLLPNWANEGGLPELIERLKQPEIRQQIKDDTLRYGDIKGGSVASCLLQDKKWDLLWLIKPERLKMINLAALAERSGNPDPYDALLDLIIEEKGNISGISQPYLQEDVDYTVKHPLCMLGTDDRPVSRDGRIAPWHRRGFGSFGKVLGWYVRDRGLLSLGEAVRKSTSMPAKRLGLTDRGIVREGYFADLLVFNPDTIEDITTDEDPAQYPKGIKYVLVNGQVVVENSTPTGALPGKVLRHKPSAKGITR